MYCYKILVIILMLFLKTGNVLSEENMFSVNNIEVTKRLNTSYNKLADEAIKKGYFELVDKIILNKDKQKLLNLNNSQIKNLVAYYQIDSKENNKLEDILKYNIFFEKEKLYNLFFQKGIFYSEVSDKEIYIVPIFKKNNQVFVYNGNFFYEKWNETYENKLIEFILPLENIEIIQKINSKKNDILEIQLKNLLPEYKNKNLALILIDQTNEKNEKIFIKTRIVEKEINKNIQVSKLDLSEGEYYKKIIKEISEELVNLIKSQNLIDIRTPSFLNTKLLMSKNDNLVELNKRLKNIDLIDNIFVQELNNKYVLIKIKYLGKLDKIIKQLEKQKIILELTGDEWRLKVI